MSEAEQRVLSFVQQHTDAGQAPLAGNSVYMDKLFLQKYMPSFVKHLHYRIVDVSTIKELCRWVQTCLPALHCPWFYFSVCLCVCVCVWVHLEWSLWTGFCFSEILIIINVIYIFYVPDGGIQRNLTKHPKKPYLTGMHLWLLIIVLLVLASIII